MIMPCEANFIEIFTSIFDVNKNYILTCSCAVSPVKFRALALLTVQLTIEFSAASCQSIRWLNSTVEGLIFCEGDTRSLSLYHARDKTSIYFISLRNSLS